MNNEIVVKNRAAVKSFGFKKTITFFKIFAAAGLLYYLISKINVAEVISAAEGANLFFLIPAAVLTIVNVYLQFLKWKITSVYLLNEPDNKKIFLSLFYGFTGGIFTPGRIGEYFGRASVYKDKQVVEVTVATFVDKIFPLISVLFFGSVSTLFFAHYFYNVSLLLTISILILVLGLFSLLFLFLMNKNFWNNILFNKAKKFKIARYFSRLRVLKNLDRSYLFRNMTLSTLYYFCYVTQYALLVAAFAKHSSFGGFLWAGNLTMFFKTIMPPISLGELGIREGASVFFIKYFGESAAAGFNASIFLFLINVLLPSLIGFLLFFKKNND